MRRYVVALLVLAATAVAGAGMYTIYSRDREYSRLVVNGDRAAAINQPFQALEAYSGAIVIRPDSMIAHLKRGMIYRERGELEAARKDLRLAAQLDPTATRAAELLGDTNLSLQRFDRAAAQYQRYLDLDDRSARVWYKLGLARYRGGRAAQATEPLQRAVALDPSLAEAHFVLGLCLRDQGEDAAARSALETAAQLGPALTGPREALAAVYAARGDSARAIDQLEALAALDPSRPARLVALGLAHARSHRHQAAVLALSRAVERFPDEPQVYAALGRVWLDVAETTRDTVALRKAVEALSTAASHSDVASETLTDLGRAYLLSNDIGAAERALRRAVARLPVRPEAFVHLATLAARNGRIAEARDSLIRYATLVGDGQPLATVATQIATYSIALAEPGLALRWIDRALDESGPTPALTELRRRAEEAALTSLPQ